MTDRFDKDEINLFKRIIKTVCISCLVIFVGLAVFSCIYTVDEQHAVIVTRFGKIQRIDEAGIHFKIPFIENARKVNITTHGTGIGYTIDKNGQNIQDDSTGVMITKDFNFIDIDFYVEYKISDPVTYLYNSNDPEEIFRNIILANIRNTIVNYDVDTAMTTGKSQIQSEIKEKLIKELEKNPIGISLVNISIQDAEPPTEEIKAAFKNVENAKQGADTAINNANKYKSEKIPEAEGNADKIIQGATATKEARINNANGQVSRFNTMYEEYKNYPLVTKKRLFYETMEELLPNLKIIITDGNTQKLYPIEQFNGVENNGGQ